MSYDPFKAVHVHYHGDRTIDTAVIGLLDEDNLLIHSCSCSGTRKNVRELSGEPGQDGQLIFRADYDPVLTWSLRASVLAFAGLGDFHPGPLSRQALVFANGGRFPFQFRREASGEEVGVLYYEDPTTTTDGGDTPELDVKITLEFSDLDTTNHPGEETYGEGWKVYVAPYTVEDPIPEGYAEIPVQTAAAVLAGGLTGILADVFQGTDTFAAAAATATLYNGDPLGAGVIVGTAVNLAVWTTLDEPGGATTSRIRNHAVVEWAPTAAARTCTHILFKRNGINFASKALAASLVIPAFYGVRAPIESLAVQLTWGFTGASAARPARFGLRHLFGDATTGIIGAETTLTINCYDGDPNAAGTLNNSFIVSRDAATWSLPAASQVINDIDLEGTDLAPGGGWDTDYVTVGLTGCATLPYSHFLSGNIATTVGNPITVPAGGLDQTLA